MKVALIQAGGTLISLGASRLDYTAYGDTQQRMSAADLLSTFGVLSSVADIVPIDFRKGGSRTFVPHDWLNLRDRIRDAMRISDCIGVVIGHGTNSLEETGFFLELTVSDPRPVVMVGAMRPPNTVGSDAESNLLNAVRVAVDPASRNRGVLVCMSGTILGATDATKASTYGLNSFEGRDWGAVGQIAADGRCDWRVEGNMVEQRRPALFDPRPESLERVDILTSYIGASPDIIEAAVEAGTQGIVMAGTGAGVVTLAEEEALRHATDKGVVVCLSTRVARGEVLRTPSMRRLGFVAAGRLSPWKARIFLSLALGTTRNTGRVQELFDSVKQTT